MTTQGGPTDADYRRLLERLFLRGSRGPFPGEPQLLVRELPPGWDIPLPANALVAGAHVRNAFNATVLLDMPGGPEEAVSEIEQLLVPEGWRALRTYPHEGGFAPPPPSEPRAGRNFCDDRGRRTIRLSAASGPGPVADVRLSLDTSPDGFRPCELDDMPRRRAPTSVFPVLTAPPGMMQRGGGGSGGSGSAATHATLHGPMNAASIEEHYRGQLVAADWRLGEHSASGHWAWSTWEFTGEQARWTALLTVVEPPDADNMREVYLQASSRIDQGGSWSTLGTFHH